uniref:Retinoic acid receptor responder protein 2 n=1 Tax=Equus caballus TaxID=9796 RepID=F7C5F1_HORSE
SPFAESLGSSASGRREGRPRQGQGQGQAAGPRGAGRRVGWGGKALEGSRPEAGPDRVGRSLSRAGSWRGPGGGSGRRWRPTARGRGGARAGDREEAERLAQSQPRGVSERPQGSGKEPFLAGTFVRLEFKLQQTSCQKKDWKKAECRVKPHGRKRKCLACIKLDSENKVLGRMVHCPIETQAQLELEQRQEAQCSKVEQAGEDPHSYYFPGQFAFSKALPPS